MANLFGSLNRFISRLDSDPGTHSHHKSSTQGYGFQILRNTNTALPLDPWFDFIIGINGRTIDNPDPQLFATELRNCAGSTISLGVYGAKGQSIREIYVSVPKDEGLGISLQWVPMSVVDDVWHILDVMPNSPADVAGLLPHSDYVIGSPDGSLKGDAGLGQLVEGFMERALRLWVYNHEYDVTRMVTITPAKSWGGDGALGCVLGYGALHRIPAPLTEPAQGPGETLFESTGTGSGEQGGSLYQPAEAAGQPAAGGTMEFMVPANLPMASPPPPPAGAGGAAGPPPQGKPKKARAHHAPAVGLDDYFAEGEQKSKEIDKPSTPKTTGGLPPPPKAGGPPKAASPAPPAAEEKDEGT